MKSQTAFRIAAIVGFLAVALGAFGAHFLREFLEANFHLATWKFAANQQLMDSAGIIALCLLKRAHSWRWRTLLVWTLLASGTLYLLAVTNPEWTHLAAKGFPNIYWLSLSISLTNVLVLAICLGTTPMLCISLLMAFLLVPMEEFGTPLLQTVFANRRFEVWHTAVMYHGIHSAALLAVASLQSSRVWTWMLWLSGLILFSGSLYTLALMNVKWLVVMTPIGGVCLLAGWLTLTFGKASEA